MFHALLLAGGRSSRMGEDKSMLVHRGKPLLAHAMDLLTSTGCDDILLSGNVPGRDCIPDLIPGCGPLGGIHAALHHLDERGALDDAPLLVIPVDMPLLDEHTLVRLLESMGDADVCRYDNEVFPCVFRASVALKETLDGLLAEGSELGGVRSMKALLAAGNVRTVSASGLDDGVFLNLNNPEDWRRFLAMGDR